ncbi:cupredoxin domain-containing protein [Candidatus Uhrbacteria bacterium]|nr:cupredoxin domain-containing protein [Candidatus Uhrbacteria bacterium]
MKKYLLILFTLALIGAGCTATPTKDTQTTKENKQTSANSNSQTVITDNGVEATFETEPIKNDDEKIVDVVLGSPAEVNVDMEASNFALTPNTISAAPGQKIKITFTKNSGFHTFVIDDIDLKFAIKEGEALTFSAPTTPGTYAFYCDVGSHRANGMEGMLVVK